ncbi:hypothetical protein [Pseudomonas knackmussii]|uniref:hypothetical protein n=1 Tax=Pseudomonas knackmussii TaxID=65741 RepID=UPI003F4A3FDA
MIKLKTVGTAVTVVAALVGCGLSLWQAYEGRKDRQFDTAMVLKEAKSKSFAAEIASYEKATDKSGLDQVIAQQQNFERGWRDEQDLQRLLKPVLEQTATSLPADLQARVAMILARNRDNDQFDPGYILLGAAYLVTQDYNNAKEYLGLARGSGDDPPASALLAAALSRLSQQAPTPIERQQLQRSALQSFQQALQAVGWDAKQGWSLNLFKGDKSADAARDLAAFSFSDKSLHEVVKDDPAYKALIEKWGGEGRKEAMLVPQGEQPWDKKTQQ